MSCSSVGAATCLDRLKTSVLPFELDISTSVIIAEPTPERPVSSESLRPLPCVTLASVSGEGGAGKTNTCRLLCQHDDVRKHFSGGAFVWIDVGKSATDEKM